MNAAIFFDAGLLVGEHHGRRLAGDLLQQLGVGAGRVLVAGDHQAAGVGDVPAHLGEPLVGGREHRGIHSPVGSSAVRSAWAVRSLVSGSPSRAATSSPARVRQRMLAGVGHEDHRPHHAVAQRVP